MVCLAVSLVGVHFLGAIGVFPATIVPMPNPGAVFAGAESAGAGFAGGLTCAQVGKANNKTENAAKQACR